MVRIQYQKASSNHKIFEVLNTQKCRAISLYINNYKKGKAG